MCTISCYHFSLSAACNTDFSRSDYDTIMEQSVLCKPDTQNSLMKLRLSRARAKFFIKRQLHKM